MRTHTNTLRLLSVLGLALAAGPARGAQDTPGADPVTLRFGVTPGTQLEKSWINEHMLLMDSMTIKLGDAERQSIDLRTVLQSRLELGLVDRYDALEDGRPTVLRRAYDLAHLVGQLQIDQAGDRPPKVADMTSPLQGKSVVFTWVPEAEGYGRYYDALEGEEDQLPDLGVATDLATLMPATPVRVGEKWKIDAQALRDVLAPAGKLHFKAGKSFDRLLGRALTAGMGGGLEQAFGGDSEGQVTLELVGFQELDGTRVARITLDVGVKYGKEQSDFSRENMARREEERGAEFISNRLVLRLDGEGVLLWDVAAGHARQLELDLVEEVSMRIVERHREQLGVRVEQFISMRGKLLSKLVVKAR